MNTDSKETHVVQCTECPDVFMIVGSTSIGLSQWRKPEISIGRMICPKHPRSLVRTTEE